MSPVMEVVYISHRRITPGIKTSSETLDLVVTIAATDIEGTIMQDKVERLYITAMRSKREETRFVRAFWV